MKRAFDVIFSVCVGALLLLPIGLTALLVRWTSPGPALYWSDRVGRNNRIFKMPKFRSMRLDTPAVATLIMMDDAARRKEVAKVFDEATEKAYAFPMVPTRASYTHTKEIRLTATELRATEVNPHEFGWK